MCLVKYKWGLTKSRSSELTAADIAEREGNYDVVALLTLPRDSLGACTALRKAVQENNVERVKELRSSAPLEVRNDKKLCMFASYLVMSMHNPDPLTGGAALGPPCLL